MLLTCPYHCYVGQQVLSNSLQVGRLWYAGRTQRTTVLYREREREVHFIIQLYGRAVKTAHVRLCKHSSSVQFSTPTCRAEQEDGWFPQEPIDLIGYGDLSMSEWRKGLAVGLTHGVVDVIKQNGKCLATQVGYLEREIRLCMREKNKTLHSCSFL